MGLHLALTLLLLCLGHWQWVASVDSNGFGQFASDSFSNHIEALELLEKLKGEGGLGAWWSVESRFHTRVASLSYGVLGSWLGYNVLALWPLNILLLMGSFVGWLGFMGHGSAQHAKFSPLVLFFFPSLILHHTQLLRDPYYIFFMIWWLRAWLSFFEAKNTRRIMLAFGAIVFLSPWLYWVRERFWVLGQVASLFFVFWVLVLCWIQRAPWLKFVLVFGLCCVFNYRSFERWTRSWVDLPPIASESVVQEPVGKLRWFYKLGLIRQRFSRNYDQASNLDREQRFERDVDVLLYAPRAMQLALFYPFPVDWVAKPGKTGRLGRWVAAWEMSLFWGLWVWATWSLISLWLRHRKDLWRFTTGEWKRWMPIWIYAMLCLLALGLVITNGGALYRMRWAFWALLLYPALELISFRLQSRS
jgi:hypothetical protein